MSASAIGLVEEMPPPKFAFETLSGEIRNRIYYYLAPPLDDSLKIAICKQSNKVHLYHQQGDGNHDSFGPDGDLRPTTRSHIFVSQYEKLREPARGDLVCAHMPAVAMLRASRKVNEEFAPLLYSNMRFTMTHVNRVLLVLKYTSTSEARSVMREFHNTDGKAFTALGDWTKVMGSQLNYIGLSSITVNLDTMCTYLCRVKTAWKGVIGSSYLDITPFLFAACNWSRPLNISIVCNQQHGEQPQLKHARLPSPHPLGTEFDLEYLCETMDLLRADVFHLKKSKWPILQVAVSRYGHNGFVMFDMRRANTSLHNQVPFRRERSANSSTTLVWDDPYWEINSPHFEPGWSEYMECSGRW